jgi:hypothetical protein
MARTHYTTLLPSATHVLQAAKVSSLVNEESSSFSRVSTFSLRTPHVSIRKKVM